jgi:hypothetical protein
MGELAKDHATKRLENQRIVIHVIELERTRRKSTTRDSDNTHAPSIKCTRIDTLKKQEQPQNSLSSYKNKQKKNKCTEKERM